MDSIKTFLDKVLVAAPSWQHKLISQWHDVVGNLSNIMSLEKVYGTTLVIGVYEHSWIHELYMLSEVIIKTINEHLGEKKVEKIQFKLATRTEKTLYVPPKNTPPETCNIRLNKQEELALIALQDKELQDALRDFLIRCKIRNKAT